MSTAQLAIVASTSVGLGGLLFAYFNGRADRQSREREAARERAHVERLSRADRHYASRLDAYREAGRQLARTQLYLQRVYPVLTVGAQETPPREFDPEVLEEMQAAINTASSAAVLDALHAAATKAREFQGHAFGQSWFDSVVTSSYLRIFVIVLVLGLFALRRALG